MITPSHAPRSETICHCDGDPRLAELIGPLVFLLEQLALVLGSLDDDLYLRAPAGVIPGHVGAHVRHSLDHVRALIDAAMNGRLDFDHRARGTPVETSRAAAIQAIAQLGRDLAYLPDDVLGKPLAMSMMTTADAAPVAVATTFDREAGYVLSHTIHHNAILGAMIRTLGGTVPDRFGYAPSTLKHLGASACAR